MFLIYELIKNSLIWLLWCKHMSFLVHVLYLKNWLHILTIFAGNENWNITNFSFFICYWLWRDRFSTWPLLRSGYMLRCTWDRTWPIQQIRFTPNLQKTCQEISSRYFGFKDSFIKDKNCPDVEDGIVCRVAEMMEGW